jgi:polysaccharide deacetylase 2 family uncharacterized protein YibQ
MKIPVPKPDLSGLLGKLKGVPASAKGLIGALRSKLPAKLGGKPREADAEGPSIAPEEDIPDYLKPTFLQRNQHLLPIVGAYAVALLLFGGLAGYLLIQGDAIIAEQEAAIPRTSVTQFELSDLRTQATPEPVAETVDVGESAPDPIAEESDAGETDAEDPADSQDVAQADGDLAPAPIPETDPYAGSLAPHPDPALVEEVEALGFLPRIGPGGRVPWRVYARPSSSLETRPRVAVVITDLGLSEAITERAIALPGAITLSFSPYAPRLSEYIDMARDAGHEVMIGLPMEPRDFPRSDAGVLSLMTSVQAERNTLNLRRVLAGATGYIGVVSDQGSGFTASRASLQPVMQDLAKRGLVYFDTLENATSVAPEVASNMELPHATADLFLGSTESRSGLRAKLSQIELLAKTQGTAVVAARPFPMTMGRLDDWVRDIGAKGLVLTPLSGVVAARQREG